MRELASPPLFWVAAAALVVSVVMPSDGFGVAACGFESLTGVPCFGCGMTRGVASITHLELAKAWHYHPFAFALWPGMVWLGLAAVVPPVRRATRAFVGRFATPLNYALWYGLLSFVAYGAARMAVGTG